MTRYIKIHAECVLPVPGEVRDQLDAVAEAGLSALRDLIAANVTTLVPGSLHTSWQSMPQSWQPRRSNVVLEESLTPDVRHVLVSDEEGDRVMFVEEQGVTHPWAQGLMIFGPEHPLHAMEKRYFDAWRQGDSASMYQFAHDVQELEAGDDDDD